MAAKHKGTNAERELIHLLWSRGWGCLRAAGSGSIRYPCPDIIAGNASRRLAIECKSTADIKQYLSRKEINELIEFSKIFGAEPWIGVRFDRMEWFFLNPEDLDETEGANYVISIALAKKKGLSFENLISP